jgi:hypothetical protein
MIQAAGRIQSLQLIGINSGSKFQYAPDKISSAEILKTVTSQGVRAELVGL